MISVGVLSLAPPPIWNAENEQGLHVVHCASAAAIFIGWYLASITPSWLPTESWTTIVGISTITAIFAVRWKDSTCSPLRRYQADTASITRHPVINDARSTCAYPQTN